MHLNQCDFFLQACLEMLQLFKKTLLTKKKRGLRDRCLRRTAFRSKLELLDKSLRLSTSEIYKVCKQLTYATWLVPDACSQVSWVFRSCREYILYFFYALEFFFVLLSVSEMFICLLVFPVLLELEKWFIQVKVMKEHQNDLLYLISFSCFPY